MGEQRNPRRWHDDAPSGSRGKFIGGVFGLALVLPLLAATGLQRWLGDAAAITILVAALVACGAGVALLLSKHRRVEAFLVSGLVIGFGFSIFITATMRW
ncbi:hypothetical protein [Humidisolicoccus flavus]|uniref:hypothetical protein n=1 Tax=Humidisolicoccus flavus TaxID=3111414 RepID=UPI00324AD47D